MYVATEDQKKRGEIGRIGTAGPSGRKSVAVQDDIVRRVQPKRSVRIPTSYKYKDLDDPVISKITLPIDSPDTG